MCIYKNTDSSALTSFSMVDFKFFPIWYINQSCHTYEWIMSHIWMSHVPHVNDSCHTYEWVVSHMNESCRFQIIPNMIYIVMTRRSDKFNFSKHIFLMYTCVCVYIHICVCVCVYMYIYIYIQTRTYIYIERNIDR